MADELTLDRCVFTATGISAQGDSATRNVSVSVVANNVNISDLIHALLSDVDAYEQLIDTIRKNVDEKVEPKEDDEDRNVILSAFKLEDLVHYVIDALALAPKSHKHEYIMHLLSCLDVNEVMRAVKAQWPNNYEVLGCFSVKALLTHLGRRLNQQKIDKAVAAINGDNAPRRKKYARV
jgi:hypothetical protein